MIDDNSPVPDGDPNTMASASPLPPPGDSGATDASMPLELSPEQRDSLGLSGGEPGETYTVTIRCTSNDSETGPSFETVGQAEPADEADDAGDEAKDETGESDLEDASDDAPSPVGYSKKSKKPREGLPDTKKMRDLY